MRKILIILFILLLTHPLLGTFFLNRYWVPELVNDTRDLRQHDSIGISLQPFLMHTNEANPIKNIKNQYIYELDGFLMLSNLQYNEILNNRSAITMPSEWIANNYNVPIRLNGNIYAQGIAWNMTYVVMPWCLIGWSSAIGPMTGAINIQPEEEPEKYKLKESMLLQTIHIYNRLSHDLGFKQNYTRFINIADQDFYITFYIDRDYFLYMRKIKFTGQIGGILPTAHKVDINNPADIPGGINGHNALYAACYLDLLLKEDISFNLTGKAMYVLPKDTEIRLRLWTESLRFGGLATSAQINPGIIYNFSPSLRIDGLRHGLGMQVNYSTWGQRTSNYAFSENLPITDNTKQNMEAISSWNQEHCNITLFYDFAREAAYDPTCQKILSFSADIPIDLLFANNSGRSLALSLIFSCNF